MLPVWYWIYDKSYRLWHENMNYKWHENNNNVFLFLGHTENYSLSQYAPLLHKGKFIMLCYLSASRGVPIHFHNITLQFL